jgi:roadblock/LC7 domain-containing protein
MFYEKGWIDLFDVTLLIQSIVQDIKKRESADVDSDSGFVASGQFIDGGKLVQRHVEFDLFHETNITTWDICDSVKSVGVTSVNGKTIRASHRLLDWISPADSYGRHVALYIGTVGSAAYDDTYQEEPMSRSDKEMHYGPFYGLPVVLREDEVKNCIASLDLQTHELIVKGYSVDEVAKRIVSAFDAGEKITRKIVKSQMAAPLTNGQFLRAWSKAAEARPQISQPGRRSEN